MLKKKLDEIVESSVNYVGVDLNIVFKELLIFVFGMSFIVVKNLVKYWNENGVFKSC